MRWYPLGDDLWWRRSVKKAGGGERGYAMSELDPALARRNILAAVTACEVKKAYAILNVKKLLSKARAAKGDGR